MHMVFSEVLKGVNVVNKAASTRVYQNQDEANLLLQGASYQTTSLTKLLSETKFSRRELQIIYRGFKQECPDGFLREPVFKKILAVYYPYGGSDTYSHHVFRTFDTEKTGMLRFEDLIRNLTLLLHGSVDEKLSWIFRLYDVDEDGCIGVSDLRRITRAIYALLGDHTVPIQSRDSGEYVQDDSTSSPSDNNTSRGPEEHADQIMQKFENSGIKRISLKKFLEVCKADNNIMTSMNSFRTILCNEHD